VDNLLIPTSLPICSHDFTKPLNLPIFQNTKGYSLISRTAALFCPDSLPLLSLDEVLFSSDANKPLQPPSQAKKSSVNSPGSVSITTKQVERRLYLLWKHK
jgi:hypothetical protein